MGKPFQEFLDQKEDWDVFERDRLSELLSGALRDESDVSNDDVLNVLAEVAGTSLTLTPAVYHALAGRGKPGWLAAQAGASVQSSDRKRRKEATRWLTYGRAANEVTETDLETLTAFLSDKDTDVWSLALSAVLPRFLEDAPAVAIPFALKWNSKTKGAKHLSALASLEGAWGEPQASEVYDRQLQLLKDPKDRFTFANLLIQRLKTHPPDLRGAEAGWDKVVRPAVTALFEREWKRAKANDGILLSLAGVLLALAPGVFEKRAEEMILQSLEIADKDFSPLLIAARPGEIWKDDATMVWKSYPQWLKSQLDAMAGGPGAKLWAVYIAKARQMLDQIGSAKPVSRSLEAERNAFKRRALEIAAGERKSSAQAKSRRP